jgi:uncharacterized membrane protein YfcA
MDILPIVTFFVALLSSILSGVAGGGGGFIVGPYWLLAGLTPAAGAASGAFMALGMGTSSLAAFRGSGHMPQSKKLIIALVIVSLLSSMIGPFFVHHINSEVFKPILALVTLLSLPFLFFNRKQRVFTIRNQAIGFVLLALLLLASSFVTSSAFFILIAIVLTQLFGLTVLQGTVVRRLIALVQAFVIFIILAALGNFVWTHAIAGLIGGSIGSYIGTRFAIRRGEQFATYMLMAGAIISSTLLLIH